MKASVNKIIKFSNVDGPGNRMAIFLQGCNLQCRYCHNPETINICNNCGICVGTCPVEALEISHGKVIWDSKKCIECDTCIKACPNSSSPKIMDYTVEDLLLELSKIKSFIRGVTFSGGECSLYYGFITEFFREVKKNYPNLSCFVDSNGYLDFSSENLKDFVEITDKFMLDVKAFDENEHINLTGKSNKTVLKNLKYLMDMNKLYEVRTVVVPDILDNRKTVEEVSKIIAHKDIRYKLIKFRSIGVTDKELKNFVSPSDNQMKDLENLPKSIGVEEVLII